MEFRNHKNTNYSHPPLWANYQLSADWRPIVFKNKKEYNKFLITIKSFSQ